MTMAYLSSFDLSKIGASTVTLSTSGKSDIAFDLSAFEYPNAFGTNTSKFNHIISSNYPSFGQFPEFKMPQLPSSGLLGALTLYFRIAATIATWSNPTSINITLNPATWRITFAYTNNFTAITFGNTEARRLFGFSGNFSGSSSSVVGTELPKYIIVPVVDGASGATPVLEEDAVSSNAYSGTGRNYGLSCTVAKQTRSWLQQYESKARTFRRYAAAAPNEFTYQDLFEHCRTGLPFAVYAGFGVSEYQAYGFMRDAESFHAVPATPGNADQFHIPFRAYALGRG